MIIVRKDGDLWAEKTPWRDRLIFGTWRKPLPYILCRWQTRVCQYRWTKDDGTHGELFEGWAGHGSFLKRNCEDWISEVLWGEYFEKLKAK